MKSRRIAYFRRPRAVAAEVKRCMTEAGVSSEIAAQQLMVDRSYLNRVAAGTRPPSLSLEEGLIRIYGADARAFAKWSPSEIGRMVRLSRAELGITSTYLSELAGVARRSIVYIEKGEKTPSRVTLGRIVASLVAIADEKKLVCDAARDLQSILKANSVFEVQSC